MVANKDLECPYCHETRVRKSSEKQPKSPQPRVYTLRGYVCGNCNEYYETVERIHQPPTNVKVGRDVFSEEKFVESLRLYAPKRLTPNDRDLVRLQTLALIEAAADRRVDSEGYILIDRETLARHALRAFIEVASKERAANPDVAARLDTAHIQYALATIGTSWATAQQFLKWFRGVDHLGRKAPVEVPGEIPTNTYGLPTTLPPAPIQTVVLNRFIEGRLPRARLQVPFDPTKLRATIQRAFRGRPDGEVLAKNIETYVRWGLNGQAVVRSSQLSTLVSEALRAVDDIAYLRWVMAGKELDGTTVFDEAVALIAYPSPRLRFTVNSPAIARSTAMTSSAAGSP